MKTHLALLPALLLFTCCAPEPDSTGHLFQTFRENGVRVAETTGGPKFDIELFEYEKVLEIREDPEHEESLLYRPTYITMDEDGNIYIADNGQYKILMFDKYGSFLRSFGQRGEGPGEFRYISSIQVTEGIITAFCSQQARSTLFETSGSLIDVFTLPLEHRGEMITATGFYPLKDGGMLILKDVIGVGDHLEYSQAGMLILDAEGDSLCAVSTPWMHVFCLHRGADGSYQYLMPIVFAPAPSIRYTSGQGIWLSAGEAPELSRYSLKGELDLYIRIQMDPEPVTEADREASTELYDRIISSSKGEQRARYRREKEDMVIGDTKPYWTEIHIEESGWLWLQYPVNNNVIRRPVGILHRVVSPRGEYMGDSEWPTVRNATIAHGYLLTLEHGQLGEYIPTIYRLRPAIDGLRYP